MKFHLSPWVFSSIFSFSCASESVSNSNPGQNFRGNNRIKYKESAHVSIVDRVLEQDETGTFLLADIQYDDGIDVDGRRLNNRNDEVSKPQQTMNIELEGGFIYTLVNVNPSWINGQGKGLESGRSRIKIGQGVAISNGLVDMRGSAPEIVDNVNGKELFDRDLINIEEKEEGTTKEKEQSRNLTELRRQLQTSRTLGRRSVLAVRVTAANDQYRYSENDLSNYVFGNGVDSVNLASQYNACS